MFVSAVTTVRFLQNVKNRIKPKIESDVDFFHIQEKNLLAIS